MTFDVNAVRQDFPILDRRVGSHPLVYLDSANTSQKPREVVDAIAEHYLRRNANVARAMHMLGAEATEAYEGARELVASFIGAVEPGEVIFTKNASEAQPGVQHSGRHVGSRRRGGHLRDGASLEHRPLAAGVRAERGDTALV